MKINIAVAGFVIGVLGLSACGVPSAAPKHPDTDPVYHRGWSPPDQSTPSKTKSDARRKAAAEKRIDTRVQRARRLERKRQNNEIACRAAIYEVTGNANPSYSDLADVCPEVLR